MNYLVGLITFPKIVLWIPLNLRKLILHSKKLFCAFLKILMNYFMGSIKFSQIVLKISSDFNIFYAHFIKFY